jgi:acetyl esterase
MSSRTTPVSPLAPETLALTLRRMGAEVEFPEVERLYEPLLSVQPHGGVRYFNDIPYGEHALQRLDLYLPANDVARPQGGWPVLVSVHGGGFIRGDKQQRANFGWHFAQQGVAVVVPNYRLAPLSRWPSGPEDVVSVWRWVQHHAHTWSLNPVAVVLQGESAGAAHVAAAALIRRFQPHDWRIAGAVLLSGPYAPDMERAARPMLGIETPDSRNDAYFGTDELATLRGQSIVELADAAPVPLMIGVAELDMPRMQVQAGALYHRLVTQHGFAPEWLLVRDHNHFSQACSVGTGDPALVQPLNDFLKRCWM